MVDHLGIPGFCKLGCAGDVFDKYSEFVMEKPTVLAGDASIDSM